MPPAFRFAFLRIALFAILICTNLTAAAQPSSIPLTVLPKDMKTVRIDGALDDPVWNLAKPYSTFRRFRPDVQSDVEPYRTEVRVILEPGALVFGIRCWDPEPNEIRAPLVRRDQISSDQDEVTIWLDPTGRSETAQFLRVNAAGTVTDGIYTASSDEGDAAPDYFDIEVATHRLEDGYSVEVRWPLSELRYPLNGSLPWGLMITRHLTRAIDMTFSSAPLKRNPPHMLTRMQHFEDEKPLLALLSTEQQLRIRAEGTNRSADNGSGQPSNSTNLGLEVQWRPRADWVVDVIAHPDFSQVEIDEPQLSGNTRFSLSQTEKRTFFLESSDVLGQVGPDTWGVSRGLLAFYSRAVSNPDWGLRATFRGGEAEGTAMLLRDAGGGTVLRPNAFGTNTAAVDQASNVLFARHRLQTSDTASIAGLVSVRDWGGGASTQVMGLDGRLQINEADQLSGHILLSSDTTSLPVADPGVQPIATGPEQAGQAGWLSWRHHGEDWRGVAQLEQISPRFVNDNGFVPQAGIDRTTAELTRILHSNNPDIASWELYLRGINTRAQVDVASGVLRPQLASELIQPGVWLLSSAGNEVFAYLNLDQMRTHFDGVLHQPRSLLLGGSSHPGPKLTTIDLTATLGERLDVVADRVGNGYIISSDATWRDSLGKLGLELSQSVSIGRIQSPNSSSALDENNAQTKVVVLLSAEQAIRLIYQLQGYSRTADTQLAASAVNSRVATLTWLAREGAFRGWSMGASWAQDYGQPDKREIFIKYQQGWSWH